jgi:hypothetical protein
MSLWNKLSIRERLTSWILARIAHFFPPQLPKALLQDEMSGIINYRQRQLRAIGIEPSRDKTVIEAGRIARIEEGIYLSSPGHLHYTERERPRTAVFSKPAIVTPARTYRPKGLPEIKIQFEDANA